MTERIGQEDRRQAIARAAVYLGEMGIGSSVIEIADCATDGLGDDFDTCCMDPEELFELQAAIVGDVLWMVGLDSGASDASDVSQAALEKIAREAGLEIRKE